MTENFKAKPDNKRSRFRLFFFLTGVAVGIFFAPNSGRANRAWVNQKLESWSAIWRRWQRELSGKTDFELGKAAGFAHRIGTRLGIVKEIIDVGDDVINQRVKTDLGENPATGHIPRLNIDTFNGTVTIRGHVDSEQQSRMVEQVVRNVKGVRQINNKLTIGQIKSA